MGLQAPELVMVEFDASGNYLRTTTRDISQEFNTLSPVPFTSDADVLSVALQQWQREIGLVPSTICVSAFFLSDRWIGIKDLPDHYQAVLDNPEDYDAENLVELQEEIQQWRENGDFVLFGDEDYYLNQEGEVESS